VAEGAASVPSVAVEAAVEAVGDLRDRPVVILGTGEMAELTAQALAARGATPTFIANRRRERALAMAERFGGHVASLDDMPRELERADIFVGSTASPHPIVSDDALRVVMDARNGRPLVLIDIAVPRDVDPVCAELPGVRLYDIDDLQAVVARNLKVRAGEARQAEAIIEEEIQRFAGWLGSLEALPTVSALREHGSDIVDHVLAENAGKWESLSERDRERVEALARSVMTRLLHAPTLRMKHSGDGRTHARMQLARELFGLDGDPVPEDEAGSDEAPAEVRELRRRPPR
jgi:glutamyl-tRNA reductase